MNKTFKIAIAVSIALHGALFIGAMLWSIRNLCELGGGSGVVEVAVVGGEGKIISSPVPKSPRDAMTTNKVAAIPDEAQGAAASGNVGEGGSGGSGGGVGSGTGPGDQRLVTIWRKINRAKYYPEIARREGVEGSPKVAFSISEDGKVGGVKVVESSGNDVLDRAAVEAIQNSAPLPFYPQPITIAVRYSLKDH